MDKIIHYGFVVLQTWLQLLLFSQLFYLIK